MLYCVICPNVGCVQFRVIVRGDAASVAVRFLGGRAYELAVSWLMSLLRPPPPAGLSAPPPPAGLSAPPPPAGCRAPPPPAGRSAPASPPSPIVVMVPTALICCRSTPGDGPTSPSAGVPSHSLCPCITSVELPLKLMSRPVSFDQKKLFTKSLT